MDGTINQVVDCEGEDGATLRAGMVLPPEQPSTVPLDSSNSPPGVVDALDPPPPISRYASAMIDEFLAFFSAFVLFDPLLRVCATLSHSLPTWRPPIPDGCSVCNPQQRTSKLIHRNKPPALQ